MNDPKDKATKRLTESYSHYELSGSRIRRWTENAKAAFVSTLRRILAAFGHVADKQLPGTDSTLQDKLQKAPGKGIQFLEARLDQTSIDNQLKASQTETEFLRQELLRQQIAKTAAETKGQQLDNVTKTIAIQERIRELTAGRTDIRIVENEDSTSIIFGNLDLPDSEDPE